MIANVKTIGLVFCLILFCVVFLQNTESVDTKILWMTVTMPRAILLMTAVLAGFIGGLFFSYTKGHKKMKKEKDGKEKEVK